MEIDTQLVVWIVMGGLGLLFLGALIYWRSRSVRVIRPPAPPVSRPLPDTGSAPSVDDLVPGEFTRGGYSVQLQTSNHNLRIEEVSGQVRYVVDGVSYDRLEAIPDTALQSVTQRLYDRTFKNRTVGPQAGQSTNQTLRLISIGDQAAIEAKSDAYNISVQRQGSQTRYLVNGLTYDSLNEIPDPELRQITRELQGQML